MPWRRIVGPRDDHELVEAVPRRELRELLAHLFGSSHDRAAPHEQPNWRRRLPLTLSQMERDARFLRITQALAAVRPAARTRQAEP